jgi:hypothetical protein
MPVLPAVLLVLVAALAASQLAVQSDQLLLTLLLIGPVLPALLVSRLRAAPARLLTVRARPRAGHGVD